MGEKRGAETQERFLKVPYHILNMRQVGPAEKLLLAHIYSFGIKGCWASNRVLGEMFFVTPRTITTWIASLKKSGCILWVHPKGRYRTIWAKGHPDVKAATALPYMGRKVPKAALVSEEKRALLLGRDLPGSGEEYFQVTAKNGVVEVGSRLLPTKNTIREDTPSTAVAEPPSLPAGGQTPALLEDRRAEDVARIERFKKSFGSGPLGATTLMAVGKKEEHKQKMIADLLHQEAVLRCEVIA